jgi:hypothetical protein
MGFADPWNCPESVGVEIIRPGPGFFIGRFRNLYSKRTFMVYNLDRSV